MKPSDKYHKTSEEVHRVLFSKPPKPRTIEEMKEGVRHYMRERYARKAGHLPLGTFDRELSKLDSAQKL